MLLVDFLKTISPQVFIFQRKILERIPGLNVFAGADSLGWRNETPKGADSVGGVGGRSCYRGWFVDGEIMLLFFFFGWVGGVADGSRKIKPPVVSLLFLVIWLCQFLSWTIGQIGSLKNTSDTSVSHHHSTFQCRTSQAIGFLRNMHPSQPTNLGFCRWNFTPKLFSPGRYYLVDDSHLALSDAAPKDFTRTTAAGQDTWIWGPFASAIVSMMTSRDGSTWKMIV